MNQVTLDATSTTSIKSAAPTTRRRRWLGILLAVVILTPSMLGFSAKFIELVHVFQGEPSGLFAIAPIMNYLLASCGFLMMFAWAAANGMFRNIEQPKVTMLETEAMLDACSRRTH